MTDRSDPHALYPERRIVLDSLNPAVVIGRASRAKDKGLMAGKSNAWYDNPVMSRQHAELLMSFEDKTLQIRDLGSLHGTFINDEQSRLQPDVGRKLKQGDTLRLGGTLWHDKDHFTPTEIQVEFSFVEFATTEQTVKQHAGKPIATFKVPDASDDDDSSDDNKSGSEEKEHKPIFAAQKPSISKPVDVIDLTQPYRPRESPSAFVFDGAADEIIDLSSPSPSRSISPLPADQTTTDGGIDILPQESAAKSGRASSSRLDFLELRNPIKETLHKEPVSAKCTQTSHDESDASSEMEEDCEGTYESGDDSGCESIDGLSDDGHYEIFGSSSIASSVSETDDDACSQASTDVDAYESEEERQRACGLWRDEPADDDNGTDIDDSDDDEHHEQLDSDFDQDLYVHPGSIWDEAEPLDPNKKAHGLVHPMLGYSDVSPIPLLGSSAESVRCSIRNERFSPGNSEHLEGDFSRTWPNFIQNGYPGASSGAPLSHPRAASCAPGNDVQLHAPPPLREASPSDAAMPRSFPKSPVVPREPKVTAMDEAHRKVDFFTAREQNKAAAKPQPPVIQRPPLSLGVLCNVGPFAHPQASTPLPDFADVLDKRSQEVIKSISARLDSEQFSDSGRAAVNPEVQTGDNMDKCSNIDMPDATTAIMRPMSSDSNLEALKQAQPTQSVKAVERRRTHVGIADIVDNCHRSSANKTKRKASCISDVRKEDEDWLAGAQAAKGLDVDVKLSTPAPEPPAPEISSSLVPVVAQDVDTFIDSVNTVIDSVNNVIDSVNISLSTAACGPEGRPTKKLRRVVERASYAALGGLTAGAMIFTTLVYTAPEFV